MRERERERERSSGRPHIEIGVSGWCCDQTHNNASCGVVVTADTQQVGRTFI